MTHRHPIETLVIVGLLATFGSAFPAGASTSLAERCAASQLKATGKLASAILACHATTATKQFPPTPCVKAAITAFEKAWGAAEAKGGCVTTVQVQDVENEVASVVAAAVDELTGTPEDALLTTPAARACAARKLAATGKDAKAQFACDTTGAKQGTLFSPTCVEHAGGALLKAWVAAEAKGGCATDGDNETLNVSGLSVWGVTHVGPTPSYLTCGTFLTTWGSEGSGPGQFGFPQDVAVDGSGHVFVAEGDIVAHNNRIQKFDNTGKFLTTWGSLGSGTGQFAFPLGVALDGSGNVFVADSDNNRIQKFDNTGTFISTWGLPGSGAGEFNLPFRLAVDGSGNVFVVDKSNNRIQKFDNTGTFLTTWGSHGVGPGQFNGPEGVAVDGSGHVVVADTGNARIETFDTSGTFLTTWGSLGSGDGQFNGPEGVAVDGSGNVFVADTGVGGNNRIQVFDNIGAFLTTWGSFGSGDGQFNFPAGVAVDGSGNVFVADTDNARIEKFACPIPPRPCGVVNGDPAAGTAICGGPCPADLPFCVWVPGTGACQCVNLDATCGGSVTCTRGLCSNQSQTCGLSGQFCACQ
jgi:hypothetical protein